MAAKIPTLCLIAILALGDARCESARVWTSRDGTAKITATFFKSEGGKVTLIQQNGRSLVIDEEFLCQDDLDLIARLQKETAAAIAETISPSSQVPAALAGKLVNKAGGLVSLASHGSVPKYYLFYYSASWCGPCHMFTPKLIEFYRMMKSRKANFEVVLFPEDSSLGDELAYMKEMQMPWPGLSYPNRLSPGIPHSTWGYIPAMVLVDADGKRLLEVNDSLNQEHFLQKAEKILQPAVSSPVSTN
jgi:thiol-disulfide isomerase/thioredoxin